MPTEISGSTGVNKIQDNTIVNADINSSAAIAGSKISGSFGKVLQVVTNEVTASANATTSTSFVSTACTGTITPSSTSSRIVVLMSATASSEASGRTLYYTLYRGSSNLGGGNGFGQLYDDDGRTRAGVHLNYYDHPNTTSATTYTMYYRSGNGGTVELPPDSFKFVTTMMEIAG